MKYHPWAQSGYIVNYTSGPTVFDTRGQFGEKQFLHGLAVWGWGVGFAYHLYPMHMLLKLHSRDRSMEQGLGTPELHY